MISPSCKLTPRAVVHLQKNHWHFDLNKSSANGCDYVHVNQTLSSDLCQLLLELQKQSVKSMTFDGNFYANSSKKFDNPVFQKDFSDALPDLTDKIFDKSRPWFTSHYIDTEQRPGLIAQIEKQLNVRIIKSTENHMLNVALRVATQRPGDVTMNHIDHVYNKLSQDPYADPGERRLVVFLEDHVPGQYFVIGNHNFHPWKQGQAFTWDWGIPHHTANLSNLPRYTLIMNFDANKNTHLGCRVWK